MIVDDVPVNIKVARAYLANAGYSNFITVTDAENVQSVMEKESPDLLILDIMMPEISGLDILRDIRSDERFAYMPVLILTSAESRDIKREALELGTTDFLSKPIDPDELIPRVRNSLKLFEYQNNLEQQVRERTAALEKSRIDIIECLARAAEYRDNDTGRHVLRVSKYAGAIGRELGFSDVEIAELELAAKLHDIGKIAIPDAILHKPGSLTEQEFELIQMHCGAGKKIFESLSRTEMNGVLQHTTSGAALIQNCGSDLLDLASTIALTHHERWDGTGYPLGLSGDDIPIAGRITAVADVYDALSSKRVYKPAYPRERCFRIMEESRGSHFDPDVLDAFFNIREEIIRIQIDFADVD
ncbi:Cyclic di-GMP phosphodiesterase response regulator RpfG [Polystyrenella longa]|uniref:Cyclic di-GMP phosphodiesterase response regulator RpfG n=2 Tax=Polystyrenella longa TaxID=2528007 RepID=A0A518CM46_9PLAN|nr:Cyclic di-GMP phosphodiesterase response regulator RpfG [Polystyrenella longa]